MRPLSISPLLASLLLLALSGPSAAQPNKEKRPAEEASPEESEGEAEEEAGEAPGEPAAEEPSIDVDSLRQRYLELRDKLFRSRARAATVASSVYSTRLTLYLHHASGRHWTITRSTIRLDGANVYDDVQGTIAEDKAPRFEGYVAPGRHKVAVRIEATGKDDERFSTVIENEFVIQAPAGKDVTVAMKASDGGNLPYAWKKKENGSYKLHLDVDVEAKERKKNEKPKIRARK